MKKRFRMTPESECAMPEPNGKPTAIKCVLYARFSPRPRASECESCQVQLTELRRYTGHRNWQIIGEFSDESLSGGDNWDDRPGMLEAAGTCKRGTIFVVRAFDRLFRHARKGLMFAADLESRGVQIISITEEAASLNTPEAELMRTIFLAVAQYQCTLIRARTQAGMRRHQKNGRRMSKLPPYGTQTDPANPAQLIPVPAEVAVIKMVCALRTEGRGFSEIAKYLEETGAPRRRAKVWGHQMIRRILERAE